MAIEQTFSIIKPDATQRNITGLINAAIEDAGLRIIAQKRVKWSKDQAEKILCRTRRTPLFRGVMRVHDVSADRGPGVRGRRRYHPLPAGDGRNRPGQKPMKGTIRKKFAVSKGENSVHGSDSPGSAKREIALNFSDDEIVG